MKRIRKIGLQIGLTLVLVLSGFLGSLTPVAAQEPGNDVNVDFQTRYSYNASGDSFTNIIEVVGHKNWSSGLSSAASIVTDATLTLASEQHFEQVDPEPVTMGPPSYEWSFGDVPEGRHFENRVSVGFQENQATFTPGFDTFRSVDKTEFLESGTQTLTVTVTAQEVLPNLKIGVQVSEDQYVIPTITSAIAIEAEDIYLAPDGHQALIQISNPIMGTAYTCEITIQVVLKPGVSGVEYMPWVGTHWYETLANGAASDNTVDCTMPEVGTWTWSAAGSQTVGTVWKHKR